jgi:hypothetical protein
LLIKFLLFGTHDDFSHINSLIFIGYIKSS